MRQSRLLTLLISLFALTSVMQAQDFDYEKHAKDSLLRVLSTAKEGTEQRLNTLNELCTITQNTLAFLYYEDLLQKEAERQNNTEYVSMSLYDRCMYYFNACDLYHLEMWEKVCAKYAREHKYYKYYFQSVYLLTQHYIESGNAVMSLKNAQEYEREAKEKQFTEGIRNAFVSQSNCYINTMRMAEGLAYADSAMALISPDEPEIDRINAWMALCDLYMKARNVEKLELSVDSLKSAVNHHLEVYPQKASSLADIINYIGCYTTYVDLQKEDWEKTDADMKQYAGYLKEFPNPMHDVQYKLFEAAILTHKEKYDEALKLYDECEKELEKYADSPLKMNEIYQQKATILERLGQYKEAMDVFRQIRISKDSLYLSLYNHQSDQTRDLYKAEKLIEERHQLRSRLIIGFITLLAIMTIVVWYYNRYVSRLRNKLKENEEEAKLMMDKARENQAQKNQFLQTMSFSIRQPLNNVLGFSQMLVQQKDNITPEEQKEYCEIVKQSTAELIEMVNDVLDLSRLEAHMMKWKVADSSVSEVIATQQSIIAMKMPGIVDLEVEIAGDARDAMLHIDTGRLSYYLTQMLTYPAERKTPRKVKLTATKEGAMIVFKIWNPLTSDQDRITQLVLIRMRIIKLFFEYWGGEQTAEVNRTDNYFIGKLPVSSKSELTIDN